MAVGKTGKIGGTVGPSTRQVGDVGGKARNGDRVGRTGRVFAPKEGRQPISDAEFYAMGRCIDEIGEKQCNHIPTHKLLSMLYNKEDVARALKDLPKGTSGAAIAAVRGLFKV